MRGRGRERETERAPKMAAMAATSSKAETDAVIIVMKAVQLFVMLPLSVANGAGSRGKSCPLGDATRHQTKTARQRQRQLLLIIMFGQQKF